MCAGLFVVAACCRAEFESTMGVSSWSPQTWSGALGTVLNWLGMPRSMGGRFQIRDGSCVSCIGRWNPQISTKTANFFLIALFSK